MCVCLDGGMKIVDLIKGNKLKNWTRYYLYDFFLFLLPRFALCTSACRTGSRETGTFLLLPLANEMAKKT